MSHNNHKVSKKISATKSPKYRNFINARDRAAERLLANAQRRQTDALRPAFKGVLEYCAARYGHLNPNTSTGHAHIQRDIRHIFEPVVRDLVLIVKRTRRLSYTLARVSEAHGIGLATGRAKYNVTPQELQAIESKPARAGGSLEERVMLMVSRLVSDIIDKIQLAALSTTTKNDFLRVVASGFPTVQRLPKQPRVLRRLTEKGIFDDEEDEEVRQISTGFVDEADWSAIAEDYKTEYVPDWRDPLSLLGGEKVDIGEDEQVYPWEYERNLTEEFVWSMRTGQNDAANENGIVDMVWIAVVDKLTDECCLWRDGLTTTEIEAALEEHEGEDADCADEPSTVPPLHFNCRCRVAPALDSITDDVPSSEGDFEEWLTS